VDQYHVKDGENPYELEIQLIDSLKPGEIPCFSCGATGRIAPWGELLSTASKARGAAGALMDGLTRDIRATRAMGFPVFAGGIGPLDSKGRGKIVALDVPVEIAGVKVMTGDLVFGDADGVVVVPQGAADQVVALLKDYDARESKMVPIIQREKSMLKALEIYGRY
jgi:regulator of RNase E activity RraA